MTSIALSAKAAKLMKLCRAEGFTRLDDLLSATICDSVRRVGNGLFMVPSGWIEVYMPIISESMYYITTHLQLRRLRT